MKDRGSDFLLCFGEGNCVEVTLNISGAFNIYNALAAAAVGQVFNIELRDIKTGLESFKGVPMRLEIKELFGATIISDVYNANPLSMEEAIKELVRLRLMKEGRAIAVLGDMLELGAYAEEAHRKIGEWMSALPIDVFIGVGPLMAITHSEFVKTGRQSFSVSTSEEAGRILTGLCREGDTIVVKGSRGMGMEKVLEINPVRDVSLNGVNKEAENAL